MAISSVLRLGGDPLPGLGYPPLAAFNIPVTDGLTGAFFMHSGKDVAAKNFAGGNDAAIIGAPVEHQGYLTLSGSGYFQTDILETAAMTLLTIARRTDTAQLAGVVGTYVTPADAGVSLFANTASTRWQLGAGKVGNINSIAPGATPTTPWKLQECSIPATGAARIIDHTTAYVADATDTGARIVSSRTIRMGRLYSTTFTGSFDASAILLFDRQIDDVERAAMVAWARQFAADNGITV